MRILLFLLDAVSNFFCTLFLLRFLMQALRVSFAGQFGSFVIQLTNWAVKPLRRIITGILGIDWSCLLAALLIAHAFTLINFHLQPLPLALREYLDAIGYSRALSLFLITLTGLARLIIYIFIGALIVQAILSWVNPYSPFATPAQQLTRLLLSPIRRFLPPISGFDLSPLVAILLLQAVLLLL